MACKLPDCQTGWPNVQTQLAPFDSQSPMEHSTSQRRHQYQRWSQMEWKFPHRRNHERRSSLGRKAQDEAGVELLRL